MWGWPWKLNNYKKNILLWYIIQIKTIKFKNVKKILTFELFSNKFVWVQPPLKNSHKQYKTSCMKCRPLFTHSTTFSWQSHKLSNVKDTKIACRLKKTYNIKRNELNIHLVLLGAETEQRFNVWPEIQLSCLCRHCLETKITTERLRIRYK